MQINQYNNNYTFNSEQIIQSSEQSYIPSYTGQNTLFNNNSNIKENGLGSNNNTYNSFSNNIIYTPSETISIVPQNKILNGQYIINNDNVRINSINTTTSIENNIQNDTKKFDDNKLKIVSNISEAITDNKLENKENESVEIKYGEVANNQSKNEENNNENEIKIVENQDTPKRKVIKIKRKKKKKDPPNKCCYYSCYLCLCFLKNLSHG